jgi:competence protein ComGC
VSKTQVLREMWQFMRYHKKYWLAPIVLVLLLVGILLLVAKSSVVAPFIYTLF